MDVVVSIGLFLSLRMPDVLTEPNVFAGYAASGRIEWCAVMTFSMVYEGMPSAVSEG